MDEKLKIAEKKVLVEIVKLAQKRGLKGEAGGWKDFLRTYDKKFGEHMSDPSRRSNDVLLSFLKTFTEEDDLKLFNRVLKSHLNRKKMDHIGKESLDNEPPEQRLVRLTLEHPEYPLDYTFLTGDEEWVVTKLPKKSRLISSNAMVAVDCEMVLCEDGSEALVRVCVVDRDLQVKIDELVKPNKVVVDYRTDITGVSAVDLDGITCSVADIQKSMKKLLSDGTILVGHGLHNDMKVLKIDHARVIDTAYVFKYSDAPVYRKPSLNILCKSVLGYEVRKPGAPHNCLDDACTAMKLVLAKLERGDIPLIQEVVLQEDASKLLLHKIPINVPSLELSRIIPGVVEVEVKPSKNVGGRYYSAFAFFNSPQEANQTFDNFEGNEEKDLCGLPQKLVTFRFAKQLTAQLYVRKMVSHQNKRVFESEEEFTESKKLKIDQKAMEESTLEVERLKQELKERESVIQKLEQELKKKEFQIAAQHKMISSLEKKNQKVKKAPK